MWNSVKRDLCPEGRDLQYDSSYWDAMEDDYSDESDEDSYAESFEEQTMEQAATSEKTKNFNIVRIGKLTKDISKGL